MLIIKFSKKVMKRVKICGFLLIFLADYSKSCNIGFIDNYKKKIKGDIKLTTNNLKDGSE